MIKDQHNNTVSGGTPEAVRLLDEATHAFNIYCGDPMDFLDQALHIAPAFAMAYIAKAHLFVSSSEPGAIAQARLQIDSARQLKLNERESSHLRALEWVVKGEWSQAALALDWHNIRYPNDMLALQSGHLLDFFRGNAHNLRDRIARVLPRWSASMPGYPIVLGMHAFGLEECGNYGRAEEQGRKAVALEPLDCWAHHAVTHVMEMQGRSADGIGWMIAREPFWADEDNGFKVHNWWHRALFHMDLGQFDEALALYDGPIREAQNALALELVDASSLLWRLALSGVDVEDRWQELADAWRAHADGKTYAFNDWHATMAYLGAGRTTDLATLKIQLRSSAAENGEASRWIRDYSLPLIEGFDAFWHEDYDKASELLFSARHIANAFGGSHAQRDIIDWTLTEAAVRGGFTDLATALVDERLVQKPYSHINREFYARALRNDAAVQQARVQSGHRSVFSNS